jgi:hypothetical protein
VRQQGEHAGEGVDVGSMCLDEKKLCSGDITPFGPTSMLGAIWKSSEELAGHQQQGGSPVMTSETPD